MFLSDLNNEEFIFSVNRLQKIFCDIYNEMIKNPESYGMVCYEIDFDNNKNADVDGWKKTAIHLNRFLRTINYIFSSVSKAIDSFEIDAVKLGSFKCRKLGEVLARLAEHGFVFEGLENPYNINIFKVLKACNGLSCLTWTTLSQNKADKEQCIDFIYNVMQAPSDKKLLLSIHKRLVDSGFKHKVKSQENIRYTYKNKKEFLIFRVCFSGR